MARPHRSQPTALLRLDPEMAARLQHMRSCALILLDLADEPFSDDEFEACPRIMWWPWAPPRKPVPWWGLKARGISPTAQAGLCNPGMAAAARNGNVARHRRATIAAEPTPRSALTRRAAATRSMASGMLLEWRHPPTPGGAGAAHLAWLFISPRLDELEPCKGAARPCARAPMCGGFIPEG